jgi:signal peptidase
MVGRKKMNRRKMLGICLFLVIAIATFGYVLESGLVKSVRLLLVLSGSMSPKINPNDLVLIANTDSSNIEKDDIITFTKKGTSNILVTHRVIEVMDSDDKISFKTKGDANQETDIDIVDSSRLQGKVLFSIPYAGHLTNFVKTPLGFISFIIIPGGLIIIGELKNIWEIRKNEYW